MNKKMREILAKIEAKEKLARGYTEGENKDYKKAQEILDEINTLKEEYQIEKKLYEEEKELNALNEQEATNVAKTIAENKVEETSKEAKTKKDFIKEVATAIRKVATKTLNEGTGTEGGYTVPEDIQTRIEELREAKASLQDLVDVEVVSTMSGKRTYKKRSQKKGFTKVGEKGKIPAITGPRFSILEYTIEKYAGYLPITNELLEDSDENLVNTIFDWLADESRVTRNNLIIAAVKTKEETKLDEGIKGIKSVLNKTLGQAFKPTSYIITNDDGLDYLDQLEDKNGRPLLNPDPTNQAQQQLRAGASVIPLKVISNDDMPTDKNKIPFIIGDLKEGIKLFDRKRINILASTTAVVGSADEAINAFEDDLTIFRGIEREDVEIKDEKAFVNGYIEVVSP